MAGRDVSSREDAKEVAFVTGGTNRIDEVEIEKAQGGMRCPV